MIAEGLDFEQHLQRGSQRGFNVFGRTRLTQTPTKLPAIASLPSLVKATLVMSSGSSVQTCSEKRVSGDRSENDSKRRTCTRFSGICTRTGDENSDPPELE